MPWGGTRNGWMDGCRTVPVRHVHKGTGTSPLGFRVEVLSRMVEFRLEQWLAVASGGVYVVMQIRRLTAPKRGVRSQSCNRRYAGLR